MRYGSLFAGVGGFDLGLEHCRDIERHTSPLEHRYVVWSEDAFRRLLKVHLRHGFERVGRKTTPGTPRRPYIAAWHADPPGCYVVRTSKLPEELSPSWLDSVPPDAVLSST